MGCSNVYAILEESGALAPGVDPRETDLFKRSLELGLVSNGLTAEELEQATFVVPEGAEQRELLLGVSGMWCSACAWLIERTLRRVPGVTAAEVMFASDLARVRYAPRYVPVEKIIESIEKLGYRTGDFSAEQKERSRLERRDLLLRAGIAGFLWMNVMTFSTIFYVSYFEFVTASFRRQMPFVLMLLTAPAVFYSAMPVLRVAWLGLRQRVMRMETLLSIGILGAYLYSAVQAFQGGKHYYFDTACAMVTLVLLGKLIERSAKERTAQAITALYRMMPTKARILSGDRERFVSIEQLSAGDLFLVKPGERIPADGLVAEGVSHVDESVLTGESAPVAKHAGSAVVCGSLVTSNPLRIWASRVGKDSTLNQVIQSVEQALSSKTNIERTVDLVARKFIPAVVLLALATFFGWWFVKQDASAGLINAIAVLVIACPCALGIATPLALTTAIGAASRKGILVNHSSVLETLPSIETVVFDKTGTVTDGEFGVADMICANRAEALPLIAALESCSEHPLAKAVVKFASLEGHTFGHATDVSRYDGLGLTGLVAGKRVFAGNLPLALELGIFVPEELSESMTAWEEQGFTTIIFGANQQVWGAMAFGNRLRPEAHAVIEELQHSLGIRTAVLSGDSERTTRHVSERLQAGDFYYRIAPGEKADIIRQLQANGTRRVAMVGDGVNDAQALAQADLGIAMGSGAALAMRAAPLVLMSNNLTRILDAVELSKATLRVVRQNLFWAFFYNIAGLTLAVTGLINPIIAAGAMVLSSLTVVGNSLRLAKKLQ
jgi:heavy metal translocating P-type ATPase